MDWIEEQVEKIGKIMQKLPLFWAGSCYFLFAAGIAWVPAVLTNRICDRKMEMWVTGRIELSAFGRTWWSFLGHWSSFLYFMFSMLLMLFLFYKKRLKTPFVLLNHGVEEIQKQNLDFSLAYESKDEMGKLCRSFEGMRKTLVKNHETMWNMVEEQKQLNAAFAHDLRTPLTVLKGYCEFLARYLREDRISEEKKQEILNLMVKQLDRLTAFSKTMKSVRSLEEYPIGREETELWHLYHSIEGIVKALNLGKELHLLLEKFPEAREKGNLDENMILEVLDNLISNAIRFAESTIWISLEVVWEGEKKFLYLYVEDDGKGFSDTELKKATAPWYTGVEEEEHFGIGLHICSMLCRIHGGTFSVANKMKGSGAVVSASFKIS